MITLTDEQVYEKLVQRIAETKEIIDFATRRDKLALYHAAEIDYAVTMRAAELVRAHIDSKKPQAPGRA